MKGAVSPQALVTSPPQASAVLLLHTQNPEVRPTASTMKCLGPGVRRWPVGGQVGARWKVVGKRPGGDEVGVESGWPT